MGEDVEIYVDTKELRKRIRSFQKENWGSIEFFMNIMQLTEKDQCWHHFLEAIGTSEYRFKGHYLTGIKVHNMIEKMKEGDGNFMTKPLIQLFEMFSPDILYFVQTGIPRSEMDKIRSRMETMSCIDGLGTFVKAMIRENLDKVKYYTGEGQWYAYFDDLKVWRKIIRSNSGCNEKLSPVIKKTKPVDMIQEVHYDSMEDYKNTVKEVGEMNKKYLRDGKVEL